MSSTYFSHFIAMVKISSTTLKWKWGELTCLIPLAKRFPVLDNWSLLIGKGSWAYGDEETPLTMYPGGYPSAARCLWIGEAHLTVIKAHRAQKASQSGHLGWRGLFDGWTPMKWEQESQAQKGRRILFLAPLLVEPRCWFGAHLVLLKGLLWYHGRTKLWVPGLLSDPKV